MNNVEATDIYIYKKQAWGLENFYKMLLIPFLILFGLFYVCIFPACVPRVCLMAIRGHKRSLDPIELELSMVVNHHVGARDQTQVLWQKQQVRLSSELSLTPTFFKK